MQLDENKVTEIFFILDEFSKNFNKTIKKHSVGDGKRHRDKPNRLSDAEVMLILIMFHDGGYRCLKHYYANYICVHCKHLVPRQVSYNRFVELECKVMLQLCCFVKTCLMAECSGV
ncbi:MAG: IS982 family transposase, partial [Paludibacteraceae bacterium]|nr:IS982 family transposase [Paludibacteraceae bacterium]